MQTLAVTIRALATKELSSGNFGKIVTKEFVIGILNGNIFAIITGAIVQVWFKEINLSILTQNCRTVLKNYWIYWKI